VSQCLFNRTTLPDQQIRAYLETARLPRSSDRQIARSPDSPFEMLSLTVFHRLARLPRLSSHAIAGRRFDVLMLRRNDRVRWAVRASFLVPVWTNDGARATQRQRAGAAADLSPRR
jgi:hypothetical protein